ncbi:MAG: nuclear transport factor 2 family protein [Bacteroidota bacterium]
MNQLENSIKEIAVNFSNGQFEEVLPYLSKDIVWSVIGEQVFEGKHNVIANCKQTAEYFKTVETDFKTNDVIVSNNKVVVRGIGDFYRDGQRINHVIACDVYEFSKDRMLERIESYCIPEKTN